MQIVPIGKKIFSITILRLVTWLTTYNMVVNYELVTITSDIQELPWAKEYHQRASKQKKAKGNLLEAQTPPDSVQTPKPPL